MNIASYDGTTPLKMQIVVLGLIKPKCDDKKQSAIIKVSRAALGLPVDTKGGMKTKHPTDITNNIAIFEWLAARVASGMSGIDIIKMGRDLPVTPSALDEVSTSVIEPTQAETAAPLDSIDVDESTDDLLLPVETAMPSNQIDVAESLALTTIDTLSTENENMPTGINAISVLPDMTATEAQAKHAELKSVHLIARAMLLEMCDRKGWRALGYSSFSEYGEKEWGYSQGYISRLTTAARIQTVIMPMGINEEMPERQTRELGKLPNNDAMREVYAKVAADNEVITAKAIRESVNEYFLKNESLQNDLIAAKDKIIRDKKDLDKAIADGVRSKLNELDNEIRRKELSINGLTERVESLRETKNSLDNEVGELQKHNKAIEKIKDLLSSLSGCMFDLIDDENATPVEAMNDWHSIDDALDKLKQDVSQIIDNGKSQPIKGELSIIEGVLL
jgi:hypothetical protein